MKHTHHIIRLLTLAVVSCALAALLSGCTKEEALRVSNERTEVCHCTNAEEDKRRENTKVNALIEIIEQATILTDIIIGCSIKNCGCI